MTCFFKVKHFNLRKICRLLNYSLINVYKFGNGYWLWKLERLIDMLFRAPKVGVLAIVLRHHVMWNFIRWYGVWVSPENMILSITITAERNSTRLTPEYIIDRRVVDQFFVCCFYVMPEIGRVLVAFTAIITHVWFGPSVAVHVCLQRTPLVKRFWALITLKL